MNQNILNELEKIIINIYKKISEKKFLQLLLPLISSLIVTILSIFPNIMDFNIAPWKLAVAVGLIGALFLSSIMTRYYFAGEIFLISTIKILSTSIELSISTTKKREDAIREAAISVTYLNYLRKNNFRTKLLLIFSTVYFSILSIWFPDWNLLSFSAVSMITCSLIILKEYIVEYRIQKGFFGTNQNEASILINFILQNSEDIDFTDGNGKLRKALLPESIANSEEKNGIIEGGVAT